MDLDRGDLTKALDQANNGFSRFPDTATQWSWRFRVLKAEILARQGLSRESLALLEANPPSAFSVTDFAVRRKIAQGIACYFTQRFQDAALRLSEADQLAASHQPDLLGEVAISRGTLDLLRNNFSAAESSYRRALQIARERNQPFLEAASIGSLGLIAMRQEHYDEAIDLDHAALSLAEALGAKSSAAKILGNLGWSYYKMGDFETSLSFSTEAEKASKQLGTIRDEILLLTNIGSVYYEQRSYAAAEENYAKALAMAKEHENKAAAAVCLSNLAVVSLETGKLDDAERYNREALTFTRSSEDRSTEFYSLLNDGRIAVRRGEFSKSKSLFQRVIRDSNEDISVRWMAEANLADVYDKQGWPTLANQQFQKSIKTIDQARSSLRREEFRLSFLTEAIRFYDDYIRFLIVHRKENDALQVAELSRARTLLDGLGLGSARLTFPLKHFQPEVTARRLGAVVLSYWIGTTHSYLWAITSKGTQRFELPPEKDIASLVQSYRQALAGPRDPLETNNAAGQKLYDILIGPAKHLLAKDQRVVIIPDGPLYSLNFETLIARSPQPHYWIDDVTVTNASSLILLSASTTNTAPRQGNLLLIGDPVSPSADYPALPQAAPEIERIKLHFDTPRRTIDSEAQATPAAYLTGDPAHFSYIHFVAHGTASRTSPLDSAIILTRQNDSFKLYARDIIQHPIHAELVTISSCFGAGSRTYSGEGLVGLSWAFLRAGAHNVIGALWEVSDTSTPQLMDRLYDELTRGAGPAVALRNAKLGLLHSGSVYKKPFYWAPFQLYAGS